MSKKNGSRIAVVGGGLAGLMATIKIAEMCYGVDLFSLVPVKRSHSVCEQGGINGAVNTKGEGDSPEQHFQDSVYGGDYLADQPFFFSSRRRHTRCSRDWSSDVCSSD